LSFIEEFPLSAVDAYSLELATTLSGTHGMPPLFDRHTRKKANALFALASSYPVGATFSALECAIFP
jgi:hypothetical protein